MGPDQLLRNVERHLYLRDRAWIVGYPGEHRPTAARPRVVVTGREPGLGDPASIALCKNFRITCAQKPAAVLRPGVEREVCWIALTTQRRSMT
jgi:hypothetical protein